MVIGDDDTRGIAVRCLIVRFTVQVVVVIVIIVVIIPHAENPRLNVAFVNVVGGWDQDIQHKVQKDDADDDDECMMHVRFR